MSHPSDSSQFPQPSQPEPRRAEMGNWSAKTFEQAFELVDSLVPKASCLYHQILPLSLVEKCLTLGMVNPNNTAALDYVRSLLPSPDYSLKIQLIDSKTLQLILSIHSKASKKGQPQAPISTEPKNPQPQPSINLSEQPTFLIDPSTPGGVVSSFAPPLLGRKDSQPNLEPKAPLSPPSTPFTEQPTLIVDSPDELTPELASNPLDASLRQNLSSSSKSTPSSPELAQPPLEVQTYAPSESVDFFVNLTPQKLWQELLNRVISEGIGRLYFERHPHHGRIFWSKNGALQLSLEKITPPVFQGVIDEFKRLVQLPATPLQQARKGELERFYRQERLLIRWQVIPGKYGEEGTLQVLRGKASQLYQQRQMDELGTQALRLAESLERKLKQIQALARTNGNRLDMLPSLRQVHQKIDRYLETLEKY